MNPAPHDPVTRLIHFGLAALGIAALVSGQFAGDYRQDVHTGFDVHRWLGAAMGAFLALRLLWGVFGPAPVRFANWLPVTAARVRMALEDLASLARLKLPRRVGHDGIAGVVQAIGLLAFLWLAVTGGLLFAWIEPGVRAAGWLRVVKELHEGAQPVAIAYVVLHAGAVLVHALAGDPLWRRMLPWPQGRPPRE